MHGALPQSGFERWNVARAARGLEPYDPSVVYQVLAWPPRGPGDPVLTDIFEGLD